MEGPAKHKMVSSDEETGDKTMDLTKPKKQLKIVCLTKRYKILPTPPSPRPLIIAEEGAGTGNGAGYSKPESGNRRHPPNDRQGT